MPWGRGWAVAAILAHVGHRVRWVTKSRQTNLAMFCIYCHPRDVNCDCVTVHRITAIRRLISFIFVTFPKLCALSQSPGGRNNIQPFASTRFAEPIAKKQVFDRDLTFLPIPDHGIFTVFCL